MTSFLTPVIHLSSRSNTSNAAVPAAAARRPAQSQCPPPATRPRLFRRCSSSSSSRATFTAMRWFTRCRFFRATRYVVVCCYPARLYSRNTASLALPCHPMASLPTRAFPPRMPLAVCTPYLQPSRRERDTRVDSPATGTSGPADLVQGLRCARPCIRYTPPGVLLAARRSRSTTTLVWTTVCGTTNAASLDPLVHCSREVVVPPDGTGTYYYLYIAT